MGSKKTKSTQSSSSSASLNPWSQSQWDAGKSGVESALNTFQSAPQSYGGNFTAGLTGFQNQARDLASSSIGVGNDYLSRAGDIINGNTYRPDQVTAQAVNWNPVAAPEDVNYNRYETGQEQKFFNPYIDEVVDANAAYMDENLAQQINSNQARATQSGAYGGSRHGVADAELQRTSLMDKAAMQANLRSQGYDDAMGRTLAENQNVYGANVRNSDARNQNLWENAITQLGVDEGNASRITNADMFNVNSGFQAQQATAQNAQQLQGIAQQLQEQSDREITRMNSLGAEERAIAQQDLDARYQDFLRQVDEGYRNGQIDLETRMRLLAATPMLTNQTATGTSRTSESDPWGQAAGLLGGAGGLFSGIGAMGA